MSPEQPDSPFSHKELMFEPHELGLDMSKEADQQLYVESGGFRSIAHMLLSKRLVDAEYTAGEMTTEQHDAANHQLGDLIEDFRRRHDL